MNLVAVFTLALLSVFPARFAWSAPLPALELTIDVAAAPDLQPFADRAKAACEKMYPVICDELASDGYTPPTKVKLIFKNSYKGVAATSGTEIICSPKWFREHPDDVGAIVHELAHVIQAYPNYDASWLVEGIADQVRWFIYEPADKRPHPDPAKVKFKDSYRTAAAFLDWAQRKYDKDLVRKLNAALRATKYDDALFEQYTGKRLPDLWEEFRTSLPQSKSK